MATKKGSKLQDRFMEMSAQEKMIEKRRKEIEQKMQQQKQKEQNEAVSKIQAAKGKKPETPSILSRFKKRPGLVKSMNDPAPKKVKTEPEEATTEKSSTINSYVNDGSFFEKFLKLQGSKGEKKVKVKAEEKPLNAADLPEAWQMNEEREARPSKPPALMDQIIPKPPDLERRQAACRIKEERMEHPLQPPPHEEVMHRPPPMSSPPPGFPPPMQQIRGPVPIPPPPPPMSEASIPPPRLSVPLSMVPPPQAVPPPPNGLNQPPSGMIRPVPPPVGLVPPVPPPRPTGPAIPGPMQLIPHSTGAIQPVPPPRGPFQTIPTSIAPVPPPHGLCKPVPAPGMAQPVPPPNMQPAPPPSGPIRPVPPPPMQPNGLGHMQIRMGEPDCRSTPPLPPQSQAMQVLPTHFPPPPSMPHPPAYPPVSVGPSFPPGLPPQGFPPRADGQRPSRFDQQAPPPPQPPPPPFNPFSSVNDPSPLGGPGLTSQPPSFHRADEPEDGFLPGPGAIARCFLVPPPENPQLRADIEDLARAVALNGRCVEEAASRDNRPELWFLHEPESMEMRFYQWRVEELSNEFQGDSESTDEFGNP
uniref:SURP motif domain-containing protein n=1 Tax=Capitella teleta TaxID=283909 RepID=X1ZRK0_CAPTE